MTDLDKLACPNIEDHTLGPDGYIQWHSWAEEMSKTHKQRRCAGCGRFEIWEPKPLRNHLKGQNDD